MGAAKAIHLSNDKRVMESGPKLAPGSTILTFGTGGVSIFALQFAKTAGFDVFRRHRARPRVRGFACLALTK